MRWPLAVLLLAVPLAAATPQVEPQSSVHLDEGQDQFETWIYVTADRNGTYSLELLDRPSFDVQVNKPTMQLVKGDHHGFHYEITAQNPDQLRGTYNFDYRLFLDDSRVATGTIQVDVGKDSQSLADKAHRLPAPPLEFLLLGLLVAAVVRRR